MPFFFFSFFFPSAVQRGLQDPSSPTRDQTLAPSSGSTESQPLGHQGIPCIPFFVHRCIFNA